MAKFGYLYLNHGRWEDQQIIHPEWVSEGAGGQIDAGFGWLSEKYGFHWWVDKNGYYFAAGYGGQFIFVIPEHDMIFATTSKLSGLEFFKPEQLLNDYILPASKSSDALPPNPGSVKEMNKCILRLSNPEYRSVSSIPETAMRISGKTFILSSKNDENLPSGFRWKTLSLNFTPESKSASIILDGDPGEIGLDGSYLGSDHIEGPDIRSGPKSSVLLNRGNWADDNTFITEDLVLGRVWKGVDTFNFDGDTLNWQIKSQTDPSFNLEISGRIKEPEEK